MQIKIAVIGLGYVGMPLAKAMSKRYDVVGYDINANRIAELQKEKSAVVLTANKADLKTANRFFVTVPTPIDSTNKPDLSALFQACQTVGEVLKKGDIVVFESSVYPGCTQQDCVPILEQVSGLKSNVDFFYGYSPERINPGDAQHTIHNTEKIVAGSTEQTAQEIQQLYASVLDAPVHVATSIEVAELAKIVENAQRDINISFINEIALICDRLGIDTNEVIDMASTKWNFMPYKPGLVGGHCISVDPYYLLYKADQMGYHPQVILSGRNVNNSIAKFIADKTMKLMVTRGKNLKEANVLLLGVTFKENFEDVRNTKVVDIASELEDFGCCVDLYDPIADERKFKSLYNRSLLQKIDKNKLYDAIIVCVAHDIFKTFDFTSYHEQGTVIFDVKGCVKRALVDARL